MIIAAGFFLACQFWDQPPSPVYGDGSGIQIATSDHADSQITLSVKLSRQVRHLPSWRDLCQHYGLQQSVCKNTIDKYNDERDADEPQQRMDGPLPVGHNIKILLN